MALKDQVAGSTRRNRGSVQRGGGQSSYKVKDRRATAAQRDVIEGVLAQAQEDGASRRVVTASSVEALNGDLSSLAPACRGADPGRSCEFYLSPSSALGDYGPLGAYGPLGTLGPLGDNIWNTSYWISARVAVVFGFIRYRRSPHPKVGRITRSPFSVSRMMPMD